MDHVNLSAPISAQVIPPPHRAAGVTLNQADEALRQVRAADDRPISYTLTEAGHAAAQTPPPFVPTLAIARLVATEALDEAQRVDIHNGLQVVASHAHLAESMRMLLAALGAQGGVA